MAIDTAEKRKNAAVVGYPGIPGVTPNASKDIEWRYESGWTYFLAASVVNATVDKLKFRGMNRGTTRGIE